ncbi:MAG: methyltransferase domain-containing protein [Rhodospirillaceae bacterium]|nr:methyltransferase domain-containing protein [Rhodospirillaceae bacterium]
MVENATKKESDYIHTFTPEEQQRLIDQALFLEPYHHSGIDLTGRKAVLEVGCGVGAQMRVLLRRWPGARVVGVDRAESQIARARQVLSAEIAAGRAEVQLSPGDRLPFDDATFNAACVFWVFEHVTAPVPILREIARVLRPGGVFYDTEVFDRAVRLYPRAANFEAYFAAFTALQAEFGGDPDVGIRVPGLMAQAGFGAISIADVSPTLDARMTDPAARRAFLDYFCTLLLSASGPLLERGRTSQAVIDGIKAEFASLADRPEAVFSWGAKQIRAVKPG